MTALETQLLLARAMLLILLYALVAGVGLVAWLDLRASRRADVPSAAAGDASRLIVLSPGESDRAPGLAFRLGQVSTVGRDLDCDVVLGDPTVSGRHGLVCWREGGWWLEDLGSTNGSSVNDEPLAPGDTAVLRSGDVLQFGGVRLRFVESDA